MNKLSDILSCARKIQGRSLKDMDKQLGLPKGTFESFEKSETIPTLFEWTKICDTLQIPMDSVKLQFIDLETVTEIRSGTLENNFLLPKRYSNLKCLKVRELVPFMFYMEDFWGEESFSNMVQEFGLDINFFACMDNQLNLNFIEDLISYLSIYFKFDGPLIAQIMEYCKLPSSHGHLSSLYHKATDQIDLIGKYLENSNKYQQFFSFQILDRSPTTLEVTLTFNHFLEQSMSNFESLVLPFLESMQIDRIKKFSLFDFKARTPSTKEVKILSVPSQKPYPPLSVYRIEVA